MSEQLVVGYVTKAHGLKGDVLVHLITNRSERTDAGALFTTPDHGQLRLAWAAEHNGRWRMHFDGVDTREAAEALAGTELSADAIDDPDALWVHELIDAHVRLVDGSPVGSVTAVASNPASDLLVLDTGALVPLRFVVSAAAGVVVIDPPAGLLDLGA